MIYLLGGPPRAKKTSIGERFSRDHGVPFIGTDAFAYVLQRAAPQLGISLEAPVEERQAAMLPYVRALIECQTNTTPKYLIEGEALCPLDVPELAAEFPIVACFVGHSEVTLDDLLIKRPSWIEWLPQHEQEALPERLMERSDQIKSQCLTAGVAYIDVCGDHDAAISKVLDFFLSS